MSLGLTSLLFILLVPILLIAWVGVAAGLVYVLRDSDWWDNRGCLITLLIVTFPWGLIAYLLLRGRDTHPLDWFSCILPIRLTSTKASQN